MRKIIDNKTMLEIKHEEYLFMQSHQTIKKIFVYFVTAVFTVTLMTCASRDTLYIGGPFSRKLLEDNNLILEKAYNNYHIRIVYPATVSDPKQKQLIEKYIQAFPEKRVFDDMDINFDDISINDNIDTANDIDINTNEDEDSTLHSDEKHYLAIYGYIMAYRLKTVSLVFQVQYWTNNSHKTERWYTLNYNKNTQALISLNSLFDDFAAASSELERYITQRMAQQDALRNIAENKIISLKDTVNNFVFIPSTRYRNKFTGIKVYINTNEQLKDKRSPHVTNRNYAIDIPYAIIEPYALKNVQKYFTKAPIAPNATEILNLSKKHIFVFPELRDSEF